MNHRDTEAQRTDVEKVILNTRQAEYTKRGYRSNVPCISVSQWLIFQGVVNGKHSHRRF